MIRIGPGHGLCGFLKTFSDYRPSVYFVGLVSAARPFLKVQFSLKFLNACSKALLAEVVES